MKSRFKHKKLNVLLQKCLKQNIMIFSDFWFCLFFSTKTIWQKWHKLSKCFNVTRSSFFFCQKKVSDEKFHSALIMSSFLPPLVWLLHLDWNLLRAENVSYCVCVCVCVRTVPSSIEPWVQLRPLHATVIQTIMKVWLQTLQSPQALGSGALVQLIVKLGAFCEIWILAWFQTSHCHVQNVAFWAFNWGPSLMTPPN